MKYTVAVDFDGVLHRYDSDWIAPEIIPDGPVAGAIDWLNEIAKRFKVVVFTTRASTEAGANAVRGWLRKNGCEVMVEVTNRKPPALIYLDDRAYRFDGSNFPSPRKIHSAKPWHKVESAPTLEAQALTDAEAALEATKKAKAENDERFQLEKAEAEARAEELREALEDIEAWEMDHDLSWGDEFSAIQKRARDALSVQSDEPRVCPTCGSDNPNEKYAPGRPDAIRSGHPYPDPFHQPVQSPSQPTKQEGSESG